MAETDEYFSTPEAAARHDLIRHLIENSELVPLVRGPSGIGKSLLASRLQALAPDNWLICHFSADSMMQPERLLAHIARCSGLSDGPGDNLARLVERFGVLRKRGNVPVLLVDDVQSLPPTSLITLLRLYERQVDGAPLVSLVLFANEQIDMLLSTPQLQIMSPQAIQVIDLPPLTRDEARGFMIFLFRSEGLEERFMLDESKLSRIYRETQGVPGPLAKAILDAVGEEGETPLASKSRLNSPVVFGSISMAILIVLLLLFQGPINRLFETGDRSTEFKAPEVAGSGISGQVERGTKRTENPSEVVAESHTPSVGQAKIPVAAPSLPTDKAVSEVTQPEYVERATTMVEPLPMPEKASDSTPVLPDKADIALEPNPSVLESPGPDGGDAMQQSDGDAGETERASEAPLSVLDESGTSQVTDTMETVVDAAPEEKPVDIEKNKPAEAAPATQTNLAATIEEPSGSESLPLSRSREWLLSQPPESYTIQLLAVQNISSIQAYINHHSLSDGAFTYKSSRNGKPWYPLLWGIYQDKTAAVEAMRHLPPDIRKGGPWVRSFASLQK